MPLFTRRIAYDRKRLLERADALRDGWRWRKALALDRQLLAAEPRNAELHARVAPLLARAGSEVEAWESYRLAIEALQLAGDEEAALALQRDAAKRLPRCHEAWRALARFELRRNQPDRARRILLEGSRRLARRSTRGAAILLLQEARAIAPKDAEVALALARQLARAGRAPEALFLLDGMDSRLRGDSLREARSLTFRIEPSLRHLWRFLRARRDATADEPPRAAHQPEAAAGL